MSTWKYNEGVRGIARLDSDSKIECMRHSNANPLEIGDACAELAAEITRLRGLHGTEVASGTPAAFEMDCSSDIADAMAEITRLDYELECHRAMIRSPFDFGDRVEVGPAWRMGPREGDGGTYHPDAVTGKRGVVSGIFADGYDVEITAPSGHVYWIPVSRLAVAGL